ncbi:hypothetical protein EMPG_16690 [Blastomyces silverae]|uniref:Uncharacterized protein n=1 Tax=Blastomyces silverae TaxID=2060906 RepID=A0A0H1B8U7_9EURO|nr:hypothetical protein EMPG_16690 [Blastomyces silverae]
MHMLRFTHGASAKSRLVGGLRFLLVELGNRWRQQSPRNQRALLNPQNFITLRVCRISMLWI